MAKKSGRILVVDDNLGIRRTLELILPRHFEEVKTLHSPIELLSTIPTFKPDVILLDMNFKSSIHSGNEGLYWLKEIKKFFPAVQVILFTAYGDIQLAVEGMKLGAVDFLVKPWENDNLISSLQDAVAKTKGGFSNSVDNQRIFWGSTKEMGRIKDMIEKISPTELSVLLTGENGVGKDVMANELHRKSLRADAPFVAVDMGAISESLFESELFGHVKGAFTGALSNHRGKFEQANGGTIFLDEIGNLPLNLQAKLLRVIQNRTVTRVGDEKEIPVDVRIICATNKNLKEEIEKGNFREDLYYRISGFPINIPSLKERKEDIIPLSLHFVREFGNKYNKKIEEIDSSGRKYLKDYQWDGNIRELKAKIEKAVILAENDFIGVNDLKEDQSSLASVYTQPDDEKKIIQEALTKTGRNISAASKLLNMSRPTLYSKISKYKL